jgi:hypothetical protein
LEAELSRRGDVGHENLATYIYIYIYCCCMTQVGRQGVHPLLGGLGSGAQPEIDVDHEDLAIYIHIYNTGLGRMTAA